MTIEELKEKLTRLDEITLIELLDLNSYDIVETYEDVIITNYNKFKEALDD